MIKALLRVSSLKLSNTLFQNAHIFALNMRPRRWLRRKAFLVPFDTILARAAVFALLFPIATSLAS